METIAKLQRQLCLIIVSPFLLAGVVGFTASICKYYLETH